MCYSWLLYGDFRRSSRLSLPHSWLHGKEIAEREVEVGMARLGWGVMLSAEGSVRVDATPRDVLEFACDLRAYMTLDRKITRIYENPPLDADGNGFVVFRGSIRGIPSPRQRQSVKLDRWRSVTFESAGPWLADRLVRMRGGFVVEPADGGSLVTHSYRFWFKGPSGPLIERYARDWLTRDVDDELQRLRQHFEGG